jgi:hypothetical protein
VPEVEGKVTAQDLAESYGFAWAFLKQHKDVWNQFQSAVKNNWTPDKFVAELRNTKWWKGTQDTVRQYQLLAANDPKTLAAHRSSLSAQISDSAAAMGAVLTSKQLQRMTENALMFGWNDNQLRNTLGDYIHAKNGIYSGQAQNNAEALSQVAWKNGVRISSKAMDNWVQKISRNGNSGNDTLNYYQQYVRNLAKQVAPGFTAELDSGMDLFDIANPYIQAKAQILQLNPADIDLFDSDVRSALSGKGTDGKPATKTLWQFEQDMRNDPRYMKTDAARDQAYGVAHKVLSDFGFMGG